MNKIKIYTLVKCALMCAICAVMSQIVLPTPLGIPLTLQVFIFCLTGYLLGTKLGIIVTVTYICMGALGLPLFSGFRGGIGCIFGDLTGGFIIGFIPLTAVCGVKKYIYHSKHGRLFSVLLGVFGVVLCHICGIATYSLITRVPLWQSTVIVSIPFILKDIALCVIAFFISEKLIKTIKNKCIM